MRRTYLCYMAGTVRKAAGGKSGIQNQRIQESRNDSKIPYTFIVP